MTEEITNKNQPEEFKTIGEEEKLLIKTDDKPGTVSDYEIKKEEYKESYLQKIKKSRLDRIFDSSWGSMTVTAFLFILVSVAVFFVIKNIKIDNEAPIIGTSFFSKLPSIAVKIENANNNFTLIPDKKEGQAVLVNTVYRIKSLEQLDKKSIENNLRVTPDLKKEISQVGLSEWEIKFIQKPDPGSLVNFSISTYYKDGATNKIKDYSWSFQVKNNLSVIKTIPADKKTRIPRDKKIEISFNRDDFYDIEKFFSIQPKVDGEIKKDGNRIIFTPKESLMSGTIYKIEIKKELPILNSTNTLGNDYTMFFETASSQPKTNIFNLNKTEDYFSPGQQPVFRISTPLEDSEVNIDVYELKDWQEYLDLAKSWNDNYYWSELGTLNYATSSFKKVLSLKERIKREGNGDKYVEMPDPLAKGFYLLDFSATGEIKQQLVQVSDIKPIIEIGLENSLLWVNSFDKNGPLGEADFSFIDLNINGKTDAKGIAFFKTPTSLVNSLKTGNGSYLRIYNAKSEFILNAQLGKNGKDAIDKAITDQYLPFLKTNKDTYLNGEKISCWGGFFGKTIDATDEISLIIKKDETASEDSDNEYLKSNLNLNREHFFQKEITTEGFYPGKYSLYIKKQNLILERKTFEILPQRQEIYKANISSKKTRYHLKDEVRLAIKSTSFDGQIIPNLKLIVRDQNQNQEIKTDSFGLATLNYKYIPNVCPDNATCWPQKAHIYLEDPNNKNKILDELNLLFYGTKNHLEIDQESTGPDELKIIVNSRKNNFGNLNDLPTETSKEEQSSYVKVAVEVFENEKIGDTNSTPETKTNYKSELIRNFEFKTDREGRFSFFQKINNLKNYTLRFKMTEDNNVSDYYTEEIKNSNQNDGLFISGLKTQGYLNGEKTKIDVSRNGKELGVEISNFLFIKNKNGLLDYYSASSPKYQFDFQKNDYPAVKLASIIFNNGQYTKSLDTNYSIAKVDEEINNIRITIKTDKENYSVGDKIELMITANDAKDNPVEAELLVALVDNSHNYLLGKNELINKLTPSESIFSSLTDKASFKEKTQPDKQIPITLISLGKIKTDSSGTTNYSLEIPKNVDNPSISLIAFSHDFGFGQGLKNIELIKNKKGEIVCKDTYLKNEEPYLKIYNTESNNNQGQINIFNRDKNIAVPAIKIEDKYAKLPALDTGIYYLQYSSGNSNVNWDNSNKSLKIDESADNNLITDMITLKNGVKIGSKSGSTNAKVIFGEEKLISFYRELTKIGDLRSDLIEERLAKEKANKMLSEIFGEDKNNNGLNGYLYQGENGGISKYPWDKEDLKTSVKVAGFCNCLKSFDRKMLSSFFYNNLKNKNSTQEDKILSLLGLSSIKEPVLLEAYDMMDQKDLTTKDQVYLAKIFYNLGDWDKSLYIYREIMKKNQNQVNTKYGINIGGTENDNILANSIMATLSASLNEKESGDFWQYLSTQNNNYLERVLYINSLFQTLKPEPVEIVYEFFGLAKDIKLGVGEINSFDTKLENLDKIRITKIKGNVGMLTEYYEKSPYTSNNNSIKIEKDYYSNNKKTNLFSEGSLTEVRISFERNRENTEYLQIKDFIPNGFVLANNENPEQRNSFCSISDPYEVNSKEVKFLLSPNFNPESCQQPYISYKIIAQDKGVYKSSPTQINHINGQTIKTSRERNLIIE